MDKIIVTRNKAVERYLKEEGLVPKDTKTYPTVTESFVEGKHVYGMLPMSIASKCKFYTEVKITLKAQDSRNEDIPYDNILASIKEVRTYAIVQTDVLV